MKLNLNSFLYSVSVALDAVEKELLNTTNNHSKKVAYISLLLGEEFNLNDKEKFDLCAYSIMHDCGIVQSFAQSNFNDNFEQAEGFTSHCLAGEKNIEHFPFFEKKENIILYHHETYNGKGYFGKKGDEIPLMSQIIFLADCIDTQFSLVDITLDTKYEVDEFVKSNVEVLFSPKLVEAFLNISDRDIFWYNLELLEMDFLLNEILPTFIIDISYEQMLKISMVFSNIIDSKSQFTANHTYELMGKAKILADFYNFTEDKSYKIQIAANLHDLGKLGTPNDILEKPGKLTKNELFIIKKHASLTHRILSSIEGMEEISKIASAHHERLDGKGYPFGLDAKDLNFEQKILASLDIYQALVEDRPYRKSMSHNNAIKILNRLVIDNGLEEEIVESIDKVFS